MWTRNTRCWTKVPKMLVVGLVVIDRWSIPSDAAMVASAAATRAFPETLVPRARPRSRRLSPSVRLPRRDLVRPSTTSPADDRPRLTEEGERAVMPTPRVSWRVNKTGALSGLERVEDEIEPPGPGEVRVRVRAIGLNFADVFSVLGLYQATPPVPFVPGLELCGVVEAVGPPATNLPEGTVVPTYAPGDRIMVVTRFGAYATVVNAPAHQTRPLPDGWTFEQGAGFLVQGLTAYYAVSALGGVRRGHKVLVHSAAGGCGQFGLGICKAVGADAIATVGSASKVAAVLERHPELDPEQIIVRDRARFHDQVREACEHISRRRGELNTPGAQAACDVVMDAVMGDFFKGGWDNLARGGRYVVYGAADLTPAGDLAWYNVWGWVKLGWKYARRAFVDPTNLPGENKSIMGFNLIWMFDKVVELGTLLGELIALGLPAPSVGATFAFDELPTAVRTFQGGGTTGKVVIVVPE